MACFRMLAQLIGLPCRRDTLEKTIRGAFRRCKELVPTVLGWCLPAVQRYSSTLLLVMGSSFVL